MKHGRAGYTYYKCRCDICKKAHAEAASEYRAKNKTKISDYRKQYRKKNKQKLNRYSREYQVQKKYGISLIEWESLISRPCEICGGKSEVIDHCHKTGNLRGSLCRQCNIGLGAFKDTPNFLISAIEYLREGQNENLDRDSRKWTKESVCLS